MNWLNLHTSVLDSPEFLGSTPVERATWLCLLRYCAGQENGGRVAGCKFWKDRQWQQLVRVTLREVCALSKLWQWDGDDLTVSYYPTEKEAEVRTKRTTASVNGKLGGRPPKETNVGLCEQPTLEPTLVISAKAEGERKGKEVPEDTHTQPAAPAAVALWPTEAEAWGYVQSVGLMMTREGVAHWHAIQERNGWTIERGGTLHPIADWRAAMRGAAPWVNADTAPRPVSKSCGNGSKFSQPGPTKEGVDKARKDLARSAAKQAAAINGQRVPEGERLTPDDIRAAAAALRDGS